MRRDVRRHTHGNTGRAVDQKVRNFGGQDEWLFQRLVVVRAPLDGVLLDIVEEFLGGARHSGFGITHGSSLIAVHGAEVTLPIHQRKAHVEILRHTHESIVYGAITVRVVLTNHVTNHTSRLFIGCVPAVPKLVHRVEDPAVHRLEPVSDVRQGAPDDHAHRVVEVRVTNFVFDIDWNNIWRFSHTKYAIKVDAGVYSGHAEGATPI